jgi:hypothetical protein
LRGIFDYTLYHKNIYKLKRISLIMKKIRGKKEKSNSNKKSMKQVSFFKRFFPVILIAAILLLVAIFFNVTNSTGNVITGNEIGAGTSFISDLFTQWEGGNLDVNIAKYLFWIMLTGLIWGAFSFAKFPPNAGLQALFAIPIGFLATAYITPSEIFTILTSYTALGIVLSFILPFVIFLFVSAMLLSNEHVKQLSIPKIMLEVFLWIFYIVILGYKMVTGIIRGEADTTLTIVIMIGMFVISLFILIFNRAFRRWTWGIGNDIRRAQSESARVEQEESLWTARSAERAREGRRI